MVTLLLEAPPPPGPPSDHFDSSVAAEDKSRNSRPLTDKQKGVQEALLEGKAGAADLDIFLLFFFFFSFFLPFFYSFFSLFSLFFFFFFTRSLLVNCFFSLLPRKLLAFNN